MMGLLYLTLKMKMHFVSNCDNFAKVTGDMGYRMDKFWTTELANEIKESVGEMDLIYSVFNCICHIQDLDDCFSNF